MEEQPKEPQASESRKPAAGSPPEATPAASRPDAPAAPAAKPTAPAPAKPAVVLQTPLENELVARYREKFSSAILEAIEDRKQAILVVDLSRLREIAQYSCAEEKFDMLADLTAVDWPRREKRFDLVLILYSFPRNTRLLLKASAAAGEQVPSLIEVWPAANWLEREIYDMFGIVFTGHPDLKRILLPEEWQGHPLRKDYDILTQDTAWVRENLGIRSGQ